MQRPCRSVAFSLLEVLLVLALMALLAGLALPRASASLRDQLQATAQIVAADLAYARSLAVAQSDRYRVRFDLSQNRYTLEYSGTNSSLQSLPPSPFRESSTATTEQVVNLSTLPHLGIPVRLVAVVTAGTCSVATDRIEFGPLGSTTSSNFTLIWLGAGTGASTRYYVLAVHPVTGLVLSDPQRSFTAKQPGGSL